MARKAAAVDLDELESETVTATATYRGREIQLQFYPERYARGSRRIRRMAREDAGAADQEGATTEFFLDVLSGWSIQRSGKPVPITREVISEMSEEMLGAFGAAMAEALRPGEPNASS